MISRISTFARDFIYTGLGLPVDHFMSEASQIKEEEELEWPIYRQLEISQYALKIIFSLAVTLAITAVGTIVSRIRAQNLSLAEQGKIDTIIIFSTILTIISTIAWFALSNYINQNVYSSFAKILLTLKSAPSDVIDKLWKCLEKYGEQVDCLDLIPADNCSAEEKETLQVYDEQLETFIETFSNLTQLRVDARHLTMQSLGQFVQKASHLTSLELAGQLGIPDPGYEFLTKLQQLKKLKIEYAAQLTQSGFTFICAAAEHLRTLHLGAPSLDKNWLGQFCAIQSTPSELGFYSPNLHPLDFKILFLRFKSKIDSVSFTYHPSEDDEIRVLIAWLDVNIGWNGSWYRSIENGKCKVYFVEDSDSDSD